MFQNLQLSSSLITATLSTRTKTPGFIPLGTVVVKITSKLRVLVWTPLLHFYLYKSFRCHIANKWCNPLFAQYPYRLIPLTKYRPHFHITPFLWFISMHGFVHTCNIGGMLQWTVNDHPTSTHPFTDKST